MKITHLHQNDACHDENASLSHTVVLLIKFQNEFMKTQL